MGFFHENFRVVKLLRISSVFNIVVTVTDLMNLISFLKFVTSSSHMVKQKQYIFFFTVAVDRVFAFVGVFLPHRKKAH